MALLNQSYLSLLDDSVYRIIMSHVYDNVMTQLVAEHVKYLYLGAGGEWVELEGGSIKANREAHYWERMRERGLMH